MIARTARRAADRIGAIAVLVAAYALVAVSHAGTLANLAELIF